MEDAYVEMKGVPEMKGSINSIISSQRRMYRPPSLSESFAWTVENVMRAEAHSVSNNSLDLLVATRQISPQISPQPPSEQGPAHQAHQPKKSVCSSTRAVNYILRFVFHISLISIFESVFFFLYISKLEDNGINNTVGSFVNNAVATCTNLTSVERNVTNDILRLFLNSTGLIEEGNAAEAARSVVNKVLYNRSWIYVGGLGGLFGLLTIAAYARKIKIKWGKLVLENLMLVTLLAAYEYTFFSTVIFPYDPISGPEIARNAVFEFQDRCGLLAKIEY